MIPQTQALSVLPIGLRQPLVDCYGEISRNFAEHRWEPAELNGGKFCEVVYCILDGTIKGVYPTSPSKPSQFLDACRALEGTPSVATRIGDRSLRILIPRMLPVLYEIRNNRGVGHVGGDVNPNFQDAMAVFQMASWVMAELIRIFHQVPLQDAQEIVDALVERKHPIVWQIGDIRRVLDTELSKGDQSLLLLYSTGDWINDRELARWVEYKNISQFRDNVLMPMHQKRLLEYDTSLLRLRLTPLGSADVETRLLPKYKI